ncbi:hypothetical protein BAE44_0003628, partial [Dichanthelium oligosanthes]
LSVMLVPSCHPLCQIFILLRYAPVMRYTLKIKVLYAYCGSHTHLCSYQELPFPHPTIIFLWFLSLTRLLPW